MAKYLEYDKITGRIISEIISNSKPEVSGNCAVLEVDSGLELNTALYAVKDGNLVKMYESNEERFEREKFIREHKEQIRQRVKAMANDIVIALLDDDENTLNSLKAEYKKLKGYL